MLLGKRQRTSMKRTTSMSEINVNGNSSVVFQIKKEQKQSSFQGFNHNYNQIFSPVGNSDEFIGTSNFLNVCGLCKKRLVAGKDIYIYRGDSAFCSQECRQQQINRDEKKEKCSMVSRKKEAQSPPPEASVNGETMAVA